MEIYFGTLARNRIRVIIIELIEIYSRNFVQQGTRKNSGRRKLGAEVGYDYAACWGGLHGNDDTINP